MKYFYNNQWNEIGIKALDSMPVGTQVEYTGDTIPTGWEQVSDYSTSEVNTGKTWGSNNEPIYRKVINFTTGSSLNTQLTIAHGISNFKAVVSLELYVKAWGNIYKCPDSTINQVYMQGSSNVGYVMVSSGLSNMPAYLIIEYIKN
jgi:hypothetical protein